MAHEHRSSSSGSAVSRRYDWQAIRTFYEAGHSVRECQERFGFSNGAWDTAVRRGDLVPRAGGAPRRPRGTTRRAVARLLGDGRTVGQIAAELGIAVPTVSYHARRLGVPPSLKCARRYSWSEVQRYYDQGHSIRACCERFGMSSQTWHEAAKRGALTSRPAAAPIETYLASGRRVNRRHLKLRLISAGLKAPACERCGISEWLDAPLSLTLHHVNGERDDNQLENLQILCPNCHSQTPNFGSRNSRRRNQTIRLRRAGAKPIGPTRMLPVVGSAQ